MSTENAEKIVHTHLNHLSKREGWAEDDTAVGGHAAHIVRLLQEAGILIVNPETRTAFGHISLGDVHRERIRQNAKWGEQNHLDGTGPETLPLEAIGSRRDVFYLEDLSAESLAEAATETTDDAASEGSCTWADILLEEVFEALAEEDPAKLRAELIQVAAVATQWAEAIDRRATIR